MPDETTAEEEKEYTVTHVDGSTSTIKGRIIVTDHHVVDENGIPKISTHISLDASKMPWPAVDPVKKEE